MPASNLRVLIDMEMFTPFSWGLKAFTKKIYLCTDIACKNVPATFTPFLVGD
eukprot:c17717_g1_i1 orf=105-260(-)